MTNEQRARLEDIQTGPWRKKSEFARQRLQTLSTAELERYLRSHYGDEINDQAELDFRQSFDQALEEIQLLELAVASGFLPLDVVRPAIEPDFATLLSSKAARAYVKLYDFVLVRYLACRLSIELDIGTVQPPPINSRAEIRYAVFLGTHYEFITSPLVELFTMYIDDFYFGERPIDVGFLKRWIGGDQPSNLGPEEQKVVGNGYLGFIQFTEALGDFFFQLHSEERPYFGLAYGYWLSHYFGLRRPRGQYEQLSVSFEDVRLAPSLFALDPNSDGMQAERKRFYERLSTLKAVWDETRELIESLSGSNSGGKSEE
jgi:hypothetical protein